MHAAIPGTPLSRICSQHPFPKMKLQTSKGIPMSTPDRNSNQVLKPFGNAEDPRGFYQLLVAPESHYWKLLVVNHHDFENRG